MYSKSDVFHIRCIPHHIQFRIGGIQFSPLGCRGRDRGMREFGSYAIYFSICNKLTSCVLRPAALYITTTKTANSFTFSHIRASLDVLVNLFLDIGAPLLWWIPFRRRIQLTISPPPVIALARGFPRCACLADSQTIHFQLTTNTTNTTDCCPWNGGNLCIISLLVQLL